VLSLRMVLRNGASKSFLDGLARTVAAVVSCLWIQGMTLLESCVAFRQYSYVSPCSRRPHSTQAFAYCIWQSVLSTTCLQCW